MKKLLITAAIFTLLTACNKTPENTTSAIDTTTESAQHESDAQLNDNKAAQDQAKEREAEAAAIAHDHYDPDSIYDGAENINIPPPQLKRKLLPGEALEVKFRPADTYVGFTVITSTVLDSTRLKVVSEVDDVLDKVEMNNPNCKVIGVEPYTVEFPKRVYYGNTFNLILDGCTADEISEVYLYTTRGKLTHRAIVEE
ncbi:hypothetical protein [Acinetobacter sp. SWAC57]|uniref:hypothetical protein n=1 Tax=Acinetobacter sp. SWAC57 TaxID=2293834 RepID=UPI000E5C079D|nr:hypothetical protein [Acinetobacter sp. SWAC57]RGD92578.1 hypothetical protein DYI96_04425 [Acinetobacter sp. SWAC57]